MVDSELFIWSQETIFRGLDENFSLILNDPISSGLKTMSHPFICVTSEPEVDCSALCASRGTI